MSYGDLICSMYRDYRVNDDADECSNSTNFCFDVTVCEILEAVVIWGRHCILVQQKRCVDTCIHLMPSIQKHRITLLAYHTPDYCNR